MPILVSLAPGERGACVAHLGAMLARSSGLDLLVLAVTPRPWPPNPYGVDDEFAALQQTAAQEALANARAIIGDQLRAEYLVEPARSVATGVLEVAERCHASSVLVGSSRRSGVMGLVSLGSVAGRLLHSIDVPICFAPSGYTAPAAAKVERITVGFGRADRDSDLLHAAAAEAEQLGVRLRVACFAVRPSTALRGSIETGAEGLVVAEWAESLRMDIGLAIMAAGLDPALVDILVAEGGTWGDAVAGIPWAVGDILAIGASTSAVSRFFLGSHASKIVRSSPVPVLIVGRSG